MLNLIKNLLKQIIDNIDSGNSNISEQEQIKLVELLEKISRQQLSKTEAADYIGVSRATFDNYVNKGIIPHGIKRQGIASKFWNKSDLDNYLKHK